MIEKRYGKALGVMAALTLALLGCGDTVGPNPSDVEFASSLGIDLDNMTETESGLFFRDDVVGTGDLAAAGDSATVDFTGWLADGTQFDSGQFVFEIGPLGAIEGFVEGVTSMRVGGERTIVVPAELGYRSAGQGSIPGNAVLVFKLALTALRKPPF